MKSSASERTDDEPAAPDRVHVGIADLAVTTDGARLTTSGLGSCVGVALFDATAGVAGLVHVMLPSAGGRDVGTPAKFADTGVRALLVAMEDAGADRSRVGAKLAGGSSLLDIDGDDVPINERNVAAVRSTLSDLDVPVEAQDVGGDYGRSLEVVPTTGTLKVRVATESDRTL